MANISGKYAIVGVAETKVGKRPEASTHSLHLEVIKACLDDAGLKAADIDGFITNQPLNDAHRSYAVRMANMARMAPNFATDLALGGATPIAMVQHAVMAIESGMANTVMCVHARKRGTPDPTPGHPIRHGDEHWEEPWGHFSAVANHAFAAQRHMYEYRHDQRGPRPCRGGHAQACMFEQQRHHAQTDDHRGPPGITLHLRPAAAV